MRKLAVALAALCCGFAAGPQFDSDPVMSDGGGGIAFTGAPRWISHDCTACHTNAPGQVSIGLDADHPELFTTGYQPSMQYHLRVLLQGEHEGLQYKASGDNCGFGTMPYAPCDLNGFGLEIDDDNGTPQGTYALVDSGSCATGSATVIGADAYILKDGTAAMYSGAHSGTTAWDVCWTAPAGTSALTAYVAVVDGNGGDGTANFPNNTTGDDVAVGQVPILAVGAATSSSGGCSATNDASVLVALLAIAGLVVRKRHRRGVLMGLVAVSFGVGCVHVRPRERETLAKRAMKFSPDPAEDQLDLHMQEAREGSEGGYGTSGGGCGCN